MKRKKISGVYCIENLVNGKRYIGRSINLSKRFLDHRNDLDANVHSNRFLQWDWIFYGIKNFNFYLIEECDPDNDKLNECESFWIKKLDTKSPDGYNLTDGGDGTLGRFHSEETRKRISESLLNKKIIYSEDRKREISERNKRLGKWFGEDNPQFGKRMTKEKKEICRKANLGNKYSLGKKDSKEVSDKKSISHQGIGRRKGANYKFIGTKLEGKNFSAAVSYKRKKKYIGMFSNEESAAIAYDEFSMFIFGSKAKINFEKNKSLYLENIAKNGDDYYLKILESKKINTSRFVGVSKKSDGKYNVEIHLPNGRRMYVARSENEIEAALIYNEAVLDLYGWKKKHNLNEVTEEEMRSVWN